VSKSQIYNKNNFFYLFSLWHTQQQQRNAREFDEEAARRDTIIEFRRFEGLHARTLVEQEKSTERVIAIKNHSISSLYLYLGSSGNARIEEKSKQPRIAEARKKQRE